jgi:hypothetical protein
MSRVCLAYVTSPAGGGIEQALATVAGESCVIDFFAGNARGAGPSGSGTVRISIDGGHLTDIATPDAPGAVTVRGLRSFSFTATGASTVVRFRNDQNPLLHFSLIDGVSVRDGTGGTVLSTPGTAVLVLAGLALAGAGRRTQRRGAR